MNADAHQFEPASQLENPYSSGKLRANSTAPLRARFIAAILIANAVVHVIVWVLIGVVIPGPDQQLNWLGWAFGMSSGQIVLCATFLALSNNSIWLRLAAMFGALAGITTAFSLYVVRTDGPVIIGLMIGGFYLVQFGVVAGVLGIIRGVTKSRLMVTSQSKDSADRIVQFRIQHLFIATLVISVLFGFGRLIPFSAIDTVIPLQILYLLVSVNVFSVMLSLPVVFSTLVSKNSVWWIMGSLLLATCVCGIHMFVNADAVTKMSWKDSQHLFVIIMDGATIATVLSCMLPLKAVGLRFGQEEL